MSANSDGSGSHVVPLDVEPTYASWRPGDKATLVFEGTTADPRGMLDAL